MLSPMAEQAHTRRALPRMSRVSAGDSSGESHDESAEGAQLEAIVSPRDGDSEMHSVSADENPGEPNDHEVVSVESDDDSTTLTGERLHDMKKQVRQIWQDRVAREEKNLHGSDCYGKLNIWKESLAPYDHFKVQNQILHDVLVAAELNASYTKRVKLVCTYELLRCLGSDLLDADITAGRDSDRLSLLQRIKEHGQRFCMVKADFWKRDDMSLQAEIDVWIKDANRSEGSSSSVDATTLRLMNELGYKLAAVKAGTYNLTVLGTLMDLQLRRPPPAATAMKLETPEIREKVQYVRQQLEVVARQAITSEKEAAESAARSLLQRLLTSIAEEYLRKKAAHKRSIEQEKQEFEVLARRPLNFMDDKLPRKLRGLHAYEPGQSNPKSVEELTPEKSLKVLETIKEIWKLQNPDETMPKLLRSWKKDTLRSQGPVGAEELNRDITRFFHRNHKARRLQSEALVYNCIQSVLAEIAEGEISDAIAEVRTSSVLPATSPSTALSKVCAVFGLAPDGKRTTANRNPVLLTREQFQPARDSNGARMSDAVEVEIREIGLRIRGTYRQFHPQGEHAEDMPVLGNMVEFKYFEWIPPDTVAEASKPLDHILTGGITHVKLVLPLQKDAVEDEPLEVSLADPSDVKADSLSYHVIPSNPRDSEFDEFGGCRRFIVQVGPFETGMPLPAKLQKAHMTGQKGFIETGKVLAQVLPIIWWHENDKTEDALRLQFWEKPALLYFASLTLLSCVADQFCNALKSYWASVLRLTTEDKFPMTVSQHETREILLELLVAEEQKNHKMCAVLPHEHCMELQELLCTTRHQYKELSIERSNFEARVRDIDAILTDCSITFVMIKTTGKISPIQLGDLTRRARGCVRLVYVNYPSLLPALSITRSLERMLVPHSLQYTPVNSEPIVFKESSAVGAIANHCNKLFLEEPLYLNCSKFEDCSDIDNEGDAIAEGPLRWHDDFASLTNGLKASESWRESLNDWQQQLVQDEKGTLLLLVTADDSLVKQHFIDLCRQGAAFRIFDNDDTNSLSFAQVDALLERAPRTLAGRSGLGKAIVREQVAADAKVPILNPELPVDAAEPQSSKSTVLVLFNIQFILQSKIEDAIARCHLKGFKIILVIRELSPALLHVRVATPGRTLKTYIQADVVNVRASVADFLEVHQGSEAVKLFRSLRLVYGVEVIHSGTWNTIARAAHQNFDDEQGVVSPVWQQVLNMLPGFKGGDDDSPTIRLLQGLLFRGATQHKHKHGDAVQSFAFSVGVHVMAFVTSTADLVQQSVKWDVSFPEFTFMRMCRFLPQLHRVEAWLRYLAFSVKGSLSKFQQDIGVPVLSSTPKVHFLATNWTLSSNINASDILEVLDNVGDPQPKGCTVSCPAPSYVGTGHTDQSISKDEIYERNAIRGLDLDWELFADSWTVSCDLTPQTLLTLLDVSPDIVKIMFCLSPLQICNMGGVLFGGADEEGNRDTQPFRVLNKLRVHMENASRLLKQVDSDHVQNRLAALHWLLRTNLPDEDRLEFSKHCGDFSSMELQRLISCGVSLCTKDASKEMAQKAAEMIISLDEPSALISTQVEVRDLLLNSEPGAWNVFDKGRVGAVFIEFLLAGEHRKQMRQGEIGKVLTAESILEKLLRWVDGGLPDTESFCNSPIRFTTLALSSILERAPKPNAVGSVVRGPILQALQEAATSNSKKKHDIACGIINMLLLRQKHLVVPVLEAMVELQVEIDWTGADCVLVAPLFKALHDKDLAHYIEKSDSDAFKQVFDAIPISLDASDNLRALYIEYFEKRDSKASIDKDLAVHDALLTDLSCIQILVDLTRKIEGSAVPSVNLLFLTWFCWGRFPSRNLPRKAFPADPEHMSLFSRVLRRATFENRCEAESSSLSVVAKYLVKPHILPFAVCNTCAKSLPYAHTDKRENGMPEHMLLLAQDNNSTYPPYCFRWHYRPLPEAVKQRLLRSLRGTIKVPAAKEWYEIYPKLIEGVSPETFQHNVNVLIQLSRGEHTQAAHLAVCIRAWLDAIEFGQSEVGQCMHSRAKVELDQAWARLETACQEQRLRYECTFGPLPTYIDVRWIEDSSTGSLLDFTLDSATFTAQWLNMLIMHFELTVQPFDTASLVEQVGESVRDLREGQRYSKALEEIAFSLGRALRRDSKKPDFVDRRDSKFDTKGLLQHYSVLTDFTALLRQKAHLLKQFFAQLAEGLKPDIDDTSAALVFDALFLLYGITPDNGAVEITHILGQYKRLDLAASEQAIQEISWMRDNFYQQYRQTAGMNAISSLLQSVSPEALRKIKLSRHSGSVKFIRESGQLKPAVTYLKSKNFKPLLGYNGVNMDFTAASRPSVEPTTRGPAYDTPTSVIRSTAPAAAAGPQFFIGVTTTGSAVETNTTARLGLLAMESKAHLAGPPRIAARDLLGIETNDTMYLHGCLRVRPGLQPVVRADMSDELFFRLGTAEARLRRRKVVEDSKGTDAGDQIIKVFANNGDAWTWVSRQPAHSTVMCEGFYMTQADDCGKWVLVFASKSVRNAGSGDAGPKSQKYCLYPYVNSHNLVGLGIDNSVLHILNTIIKVAWDMHEGDHHVANAHEVDPTSLCESLQALAALSLKVESDAGHQDRAASEKLNNYQRVEEDICGILDKVLKLIWSQSNDDYVSTVLKQACDRAVRSGDSKVSMPFPLLQQAGQLTELSPMGVNLAQHLASVVSQKKSSAAEQLYGFLHLVCKGASMHSAISGTKSERLISAHHRITKTAFAKKGEHILRAIEKNHRGNQVRVLVNGFSDSEESSDSEDDFHFGVDDPQYDVLQDAHDAGGVLGAAVHHEEAMYSERVEREAAYRDTAYDRDAKRGAPLFSEKYGFGRPLITDKVVMSMFDADFPLYFVWLDSERLKLSYTMADGLPLAYLVHKNIVAQLVNDALVDGSDDSMDIAITLRDKLLSWIANILRSPLSSETKTWILHKIEQKGMTPHSPPQKMDHVNLTIISYCLCRCCPTDTKEAGFLKEHLCKTWNIEKSVRNYIQRKSDMYGVYIVKGGTIMDLRNLGLHIAVRDFEREVWQRSLNNNSMYLDIISQFSSYCCIVYVQGLPKIADILLKWLAEYTRHHPWRFVFLENVDASWNFSENRDRCNFNFALQNPAHMINTAADLQNLHIADVRPNHICEYEQRFVPQIGECSRPEDLKKHFEKELGSAESNDESKMFFSATPPLSGMQADFRRDLEKHLFRPEPCFILLVSPPGAGKTYHMDEISKKLERELHITLTQFDGSSDILVTHTLAELLQDAVAGGSGEGRMLILDEYHMLSDDQKVEFFEWVADKLSSLRVVLIANRIDSKDREKIEACRKLKHEQELGHHESTVILLETRLTRSKVLEVMTTRKNTESLRPLISDWFVASRLVFGEESISLRLVDPIDRILANSTVEGRRGALISLLLDKVPTISRVAAEDFVSAFLDHITSSTRPSSTSGSGGPFAVMFRVAKLDLHRDQLCSFTEFLSRLPDACKAPPAVRILCWCTYAISFYKPPAGIDLSAIMAFEFVDQVNTPFQLREPSAGSCVQGRAFSWGGDYSDLEDLIDAVKHGHSIDWADVRRKQWSKNFVTDGPQLCRLLSSARNPGKCLDNLQALNIRNLLRNSHERTASQLARYVLKYRCHQSAVDIDNPYFTALWISILHDTSIVTVQHLLQITDNFTMSSSFPVNLLDGLLWAREHAQDMLKTTCTPAEKRDKLLQQALVALSVLLDMTGTPEQVEHLGKLWCGAFAKLMTIPLMSTENWWKRINVKEVIASDAAADLPVCLPSSVLRKALMQLDAYEEDWPREVILTWRLLKCRAQGPEVKDLWEKKAEFPLFFDFTGASSPPIHSDVAAGVLKITSGKLEESLQKYMLTTNCEIPSHITRDDFILMTGDALQKLKKEDLRIRCTAALRQAIEHEIPA